MLSIQSNSPREFISIPSLKVENIPYSSVLMTQAGTSSTRTWSKIIDKFPVNIGTVAKLMQMINKYFGFLSTEDAELFNNIQLYTTRLNDYISAIQKEYTQKSKDFEQQFRGQYPTEESVETHAKFLNEMREKLQIAQQILDDYVKHHAGSKYEHLNMLVDAHPTLCGFLPVKIGQLEVSITHLKNQLDVATRLNALENAISNYPHGVRPSQKTWQAREGEENWKKFERITTEYRLLMKTLLIAAFTDPALKQRYLRNWITFPLNPSFIELIKHSYPDLFNQIDRFSKLREAIQDERIADLQHRIKDTQSNILLYNQHIKETNQLEMDNHHLKTAISEKIALLASLRQDSSISGRIKLLWNSWNAKEDLENAKNKIKKNEKRIQILKNASVRVFNVLKMQVQFIPAEIDELRKRKDGQGFLSKITTVQSQFEQIKDHEKMTQDLAKATEGQIKPKSPKDAQKWEELLTSVEVFHRKGLLPIGVKRIDLYQFKSLMHHAYPTLDGRVLSLVKLLEARPTVSISDIPLAFKKEVEDELASYAPKKEGQIEQRKQSVKKITFSKPPRPFRSLKPNLEPMKTPPSHLPYQVSVNSLREELQLRKQESSVVELEVEEPEDIAETDQIADDFELELFKKNYLH